MTVEVIEGASTPGGGCRTEGLTVTGFRHDVCSAAHPLVAASEFFRGPVEAGSIDLLQPRVAFAHPLDGGREAIAIRDVEFTARGLGRDAVAYRRLMSPLVRDSDDIVSAVMSPQDSGSKACSRPAAW
jgi:phytoene dehydrogenase-like protein